jgi:hypothetical protein
MPEISKFFRDSWLNDLFDISGCHGRILGACCGDHGNDGLSNLGHAFLDPEDGMRLWLQEHALHRGLASISVLGGMMVL